MNGRGWLGWPRAGRAAEAVEVKLPPPLEKLPPPLEKLAPLDALRLEAAALDGTLTGRKLPPPPSAAEEAASAEQRKSSIAQSRARMLQRAPCRTLAAICTTARVAAAPRLLEPIHVVHQAFGRVARPRRFIEPLGHCGIRARRRC